MASHRICRYRSGRDRRWLESFDELLSGQACAGALPDVAHAGTLRRTAGGHPRADVDRYVNTIPTELEPWFPGDGMSTATGRSVNAAIRAHGRRPVGGGHISTYASSAALEVGFDHFFRGKSHPAAAIRPTSGPRLAGHLRLRLSRGPATADQLDGFRQSTATPAAGYRPIPRGRCRTWEFPTVSMGLAP
jgi:pyruvate dehydrogenase E1 component